MTIKEATGG